MGLLDNVQQSAAKKMLRKFLESTKSKCMIISLDENDNEVIETLPDSITVAEIDRLRSENKALKNLLENGFE